MSGDILHQLKCYLHHWWSAEWELFP